MPLLQPNFQREMEVMKEVLTSSASENQISSKHNQSQKNVARSRARVALDQNNLSIEESVESMARLASYTEDDRLKFKVFETALNVHGAIGGDDQNGNTGIQINFIIDGETKGFSDILFPRGKQIEVELKEQEEGENGE